VRESWSRGLRHQGRQNLLRVGAAHQPQLNKPVPVANLFDSGKLLQRPRSPVAVTRMVSSPY